MGRTSIDPLEHQDPRPIATDRRERLWMGLAAGGIAAAIALAAGLTEAFRGFEARTGDLRLRAEAALTAAPADSSIVIIDIDNASLRAFGPTLGRWPWPRDAHAAILDLISLGRPRAIGYDVLFAEPDPARPSGDLALAEATERAPASVIHAAVFERPLPADAASAAAESPALRSYALRVDAPASMAPRYAEVAAPLPSILSGADGVGGIDRTPDPDGVERLEPVLGRHGGRTYPSFALALALGGRAGYDRLVLLDDRLHLDGSTIPLEHGRLRAHWRGGYAERPYAVVPAHAVLRAYSAIATGSTPELDPAVFAGRVVLVGSSATGVGDILASPFGPTEPGVLLHATLLDTIVSRDFLHVPNPPVAATITALVALLAGVVVALARSVRASSLGVLAVLLGWSSIVLAASLATGWFLPWTGPLLGAILAYGTASAGQWLTEGRRHREIKQAFGKFLPPDVVERIAADRGLQRRADRRELSILFADVRGFTTLSERYGPERIVEMLNELFAAMVEVVFRHGGALDKFLGDGLMALFGAPIHQSDHAARACRAALEMQERLVRLNGAWGVRGYPTLAIGIGIHSGTAIVGFVGDVERRLEYTAIGDAVNLASRLQEHCKEVGAPILVSAETSKQAGEEFVTHPLGEVRVRGRVEPVAVLSLESSAVALESGAVPP